MNRTMAAIRGIASAGLLIAAVAQAAPQGDMAQARQDFALVPLQDGTALAVGGSDYASSERFDPSTGAWRTLTAMLAAHYGSNTAVTLADGRVLAAGGGGTVSEVYTPSTDSWALSGSLLTYHYGQTMTLLRDGRVLLAGGCETGSCADAQLYLPWQGVWAPAPDMKAWHYGATATLLSDGTVLVAGGSTSAAEIFDPGSNRWTQVGAMSVSRSWHAAALLPDGSVLVSGGCNGYYCDSAEIYQPRLRQWRPAQAMRYPRIDHTATTLLDGRVVVSGGESFCVPDLQQPDNFHCTGFLAAEAYDPMTGLWSNYAMMSTPRIQHAAVRLPAGRVFVAGGQAWDGTFDTGPALASSETVTP